VPAPSAAEAVPAPATIATPPANKHYFWGVGRRKAAVARVRIRPGQGEFQINKRDIDRYFTEPRDRRLVVAPLTATGTKGKVDVFVNVGGGGFTGQAGAIVLGIARALKQANPDYENVLRDRGYLTRDSRIVERKKYGQRGARRRFQFSKR
jgi:small subunit ribosomal protein S9